MTGDTEGAGGAMGTATGRVIRRILVSLGIGGLTFGLTSLVASAEANQAALTALTLSIFLGGVVLVVQFLNEFDSRLRVIEEKLVVHERSIDDTVNGALTRINDSARLFGLLEETAARSDAVTQMVRNAILITPAHSDLVYSFAQSEIGRTSTFLRALASGEATYEGEDRDWLIGLTNCTHGRIDATSFATVDAGGTSFSDGFWGTPLGRRYLQAQEEAVHDRNVVVRRVFIFDMPHLQNDKGFVEICAQQARVGIEVRILDFRSIKQSHLMDLRDFILFDNGVSYETVVSPSRTDTASPAILNTKLVLDIAQIRKRAADFEYLWSLGQPFDRVPAEQAAGLKNP